MSSYSCFNSPSQVSVVEYVTVEFSFERAQTKAFTSFKENALLFFVSDSSEVNKNNDVQIEKFEGIQTLFTPVVVKALIQEHRF